MIMEGCAAAQRYGGWMDSFQGYPMREVVVMAWCDACALEDAKTAAVTTYTVGVVAGESRPALKLLELCERHNKLIAEVQQLLADVGQQPELGPKAATRAQTAYVSSGAAEHVLCPICQASVTRQALINHVW